MIERSAMDILNDADTEIRSLVEQLPYVKADALGLDPRAGRVWVDIENGQLISRRSGSLDYYGGFQYVDDGDKAVSESFAIYLDSNDRVADAIEHYEDNHNDD